MVPVEIEFSWSENKSIEYIRVISPPMNGELNEAAIMKLVTTSKRELFLNSEAKSSNLRTITVAAVKCKIECDPKRPFEYEYEYNIRNGILIERNYPCQ